MMKTGVMQTDVSGKENKYQPSLQKDAKMSCSNKKREI